jgi:hypothetical protein
MKKITSCGLILLMPFFIAVSSWASEDYETEYYKAVATHFNVSADTMEALMEMDLEDEDLPVVLFLAGHNKTGPTRIAGLRAKGESWMSIMENRVISPSVFYFILAGKIESKTFAPIFARYDSIPDKKWHEMSLSDDEIRDIVNLKFIYSYHDYSVFEVMKMRDLGKSYLKINFQVKQKKEEMIKEEKRRRKEEAKKKQAEGE